MSRTGTTTGSSAVGPNPSGQAVCASLHPQESMQMVPKFCFPFDVERYGRKQTSEDPGIQTSHGPLSSQTPRDSDSSAHMLRDLKFRGLGTLANSDLYTKGLIYPGTQGSKGPGIQGPRNPGVQGPRASGAQRSRDSGTQGLRDPGTQGPRASGIQVLRGPGAQGPRGLEIQGLWDPGTQRTRDRGTQGLREPGTLSTRDLYAQGPRLMDTV